MDNITSGIELIDEYSFLDICGGTGIFNNCTTGIIMTQLFPQLHRQQVKMVNTNYTFNNCAKSGITNVGGDLSILDTSLNFSNNLIGINMKEDWDNQLYWPEPTLTITNSTCTFSGSSDIEKSNKDIGIDASNSVIKIQDSTTYFTNLYSSLRSISSEIDLTKSDILIMNYISTLQPKPFDIKNSLLNLSGGSIQTDTMLDSNYTITLTDKSILQSNGIPLFYFKGKSKSFFFDNTSQVSNSPIYYKGKQLLNSTNHPYDFSFVSM
jgi:hypothetical protein